MLSDINFLNKCLEEHIWLGASGYEVISHVHVKLKKFGPQFWHFLISIILCDRIYTTLIICNDQYVPILWLEITSKLHAHSTSSINMVTINRKQLQVHV